MYSGFVLMRRGKTHTNGCHEVGSFYTSRSLETGGKACQAMQGGPHGETLGLVRRQREWKGNWKTLYYGKVRVFSREGMSEVR